MDENKISNHICSNMHHTPCREHGARAEQNDARGTLWGSMCKECENRCEREHGGEVYVADLACAAGKSRDFRVSAWTGRYLQCTLMRIPRGTDIGFEVHSDTDQYIRIERGYGELVWKDGEHCVNKRQRIRAGESIFIPAGTWHNIVNVGRCDLSISSIYAPPHHPRCTVEKYKE